MDSSLGKPYLEQTELFGQFRFMDSCVQSNDTLSQTKAKASVTPKFQLNFAGIIIQLEILWVSLIKKVMETLQTVSIGEIILVQ